jgi:uncharacterized protein
VTRIPSINLVFTNYNGDGVAKDLAEAVKWYRRAAEQNYVLAQYDLGVCYAKGNGVPRDYVKAYMWWLLAAAQGNKHRHRRSSSLRSLVGAGLRS